MKALFVLSTIVLSSMAWSAAEWKTIAVTSDCAQKVSIEAKEGESFIYAVQDGKKTKLTAENNKPFKLDTPASTAYSNTKEDAEKNKSALYTFTQPSMVEANLAQIDVNHNGKRDRCKLVNK